MGGGHLENTAAPWMTAHRLTALVGHSGTGKTEVAVNLVFALARAGVKTALADLDVVNPYFRSRERRDMFRQLGIRFVSSSQTLVDADLPALPAELNTLLQDQSLRSVLDIGGDSGARVLSRYRHQIAAQDREMLFVLNARRPQVSTPEAAAWNIRRIEDIMGLPMDGIVNNTHLCGETTREDILLGAELAETVSYMTGIPVVCHTAERALAASLPPLAEPVFPIDIYMKKPWDK